MILVALIGLCVLIRFWLWFIDGSERLRRCLRPWLGCW